MKHRRVTVSSTGVEQRARCPRRSLPPLPFLRLRGRWLESAGFAIGQAVRVIVASGVIVLEALPGDLHAKRD